MTWARNYGATHYGAASTETRRAKRITWKCLDCPSLIYGPGKKRCAPCYDIVLHERAKRANANAKRHRLAKKAQNGGAT